MVILPSNVYPGSHVADKTVPGLIGASVGFNCIFGHLPLPIVHAENEHCLEKTIT